MVNDLVDCRVKIVGRRLGEELDVISGKVAVRDMDHYQFLLLNKITRIEGVTGVHSSFVLRRVVDKTTLSVV